VFDNFRKQIISPPPSHKIDLIDYDALVSEKSMEKAKEVEETQNVPSDINNFTMCETSILEKTVEITAEVEEKVKLPPIKEKLLAKSELITTEHSEPFFSSDSDLSKTIIDDYKTEQQKKRDKIFSKFKEDDMKCINGNELTNNFNPKRKSKIVYQKSLKIKQLAEQLENHILKDESACSDGKKINSLILMSMLKFLWKNPSLISEKQRR